MTRCQQYRHFPQQRRWVVAARPDWISFFTEWAFSARRFVCGKDKVKLWRCIEEYEERMEEVWGFSCEVVRKKPADQYCVVASGDSVSIATYKILRAVGEMGLSSDELDCFREALRKSNMWEVDRKGWWREYHAVAGSRLWAPSCKGRN